jgi:hypothetical protein
MGFSLGIFFGDFCLDIAWVFFTAWNMILSFFRSYLGPRLFLVWLAGMALLVAVLLFFVMVVLYGVLGFSAVSPPLSSPSSLFSSGFKGRHSPAGLALVDVGGGLYKAPLSGLDGALGDVRVIIGSRLVGVLSPIPRSSSGRFYGWNWEYRSSDSFSSGVVDVSRGELRVFLVSY